MKKIFSFTKKKKQQFGTPDNGSVLSAGYDLKEKDLGKVHKAAFIGDLVKLKQLAKKNDINQLDKENRTALHIGCASGHADVVQFLVESKAKLNLCDNQNRSALMKAVQGQHERCVNILLENHAEPNLVDINGNTALHLAANIPSISTAVLLLEYGADINTHNKEGFTPLTVAVREDHIEMAEFLLKESADVNAVDQEQRSPLMLAAGNGQISMVKLLLKFNADITLTDSKGLPAEEYALMTGHHPCSLLITEHATQRTGGALVLNQGPSKKKKGLGNPSQDVEAGLSLGGPATDKNNVEDHSLSESASRVSKSADDEWPSSDEDESLLDEKKPSKEFLNRMFASKKEASALLDTSPSCSESEPETANRGERTPSIPKASTSSNTPSVDTPSGPLLPKASQMSSTPLSKDRKKEESTDNEDYSDEEQDQVKEDEEEEDVSDVNNQSEGGEESTSPAPEGEDSQEKKRDFLSELGLEEGEDQDSFDSESNSENENVPHKDNQHEELSPTEATLGEHMFYIPSFLRGGEGSRMAEIEPYKCVGWPQSSQREAANISKDPDDKGDAPQKEKTKWETLSVLNKPKENFDSKKDFMEELGLGDVDDLEDASDWDSASTTSKRTLPGRRTVSPGLEELRHDSKLCNKDQEGDAVPASTPPRSLGSDNTPSKPAPQPQPQARTMLLQKAESEEKSDWDADEVTSPDDNQLKPLAEPPAAAEPGSHELSLRAEDSDGSSEFDEQQQMEKDDAVDRCELDSDSCGVDDGEQDGEFSPEGPAAGDAPWEKRYEKLWVEVEKKEVKSTFKSVASELKEKFGELFKSTPPTENREEAAAALTSADEDSSDEEGGDVFVRPVARARSTVLVTIPEQRESGQEDSAAESLDEERMQKSEDSRVPHKLDLPNPDVLESVSSQIDSTQKENTERMNIKDLVVTSIRSVVQEDPKTEVGPPLKDLPADLSEADWTKTRPEDESQLFIKSRRASEEDRKRFKLEVGKETLNTAMKNQKSSASLDGGGTTVEEVDAEKPDPGSGFVLSRSGGIHRTNRDPALSHLPVQLSCSSRKQEKQGVSEPLQLEVVRGARLGRAPQTSTHANGDPLSVFDDSSLSDVSDDDQRLTHAGQQKIKNPEDVDVAEEFDELTQSSDTATDDLDSLMSGYRHASLLVQKLDSVNFDSTSITKLQNIFHEYERSNQKLRSRHRYLSDKVGQLEMERAELKNSLEEVKDLKSLLEQSQLELQTEITNLKFQLKQEQENRHNANMMYNTTRDKLRRTEEQQQLEIQDRQKVELALRNQELEMRTLISNMKQLEEVHSETQRLLAQERSARTLQESLLSSHVRKQQEMQTENKRSLSRSNEALSQLTEASERERELLQQTAALQEQLSTLRADLERSQANSSLKESHLSEENEVLKEQLEDVRRDLKISNETVTQTVFSCNNQLSAMKSELALTTSRLENERQTREALQSELESTRSRLAGAVKEAELRLAAHSDSEKALLREKEEHQRLKDRLSGEVANQREAASSLSQKLAKAEARSNSMENEVHRVTLQLTEKALLLEVLQREKDQAATRVKELESALQAERELVSRAGARHEATQERLAQAQSEAMLLRQQLEEAQNKGVAKERAVTDAQERFSDILSQLRSDSEERVQLVEDRNKELASKAVDLRDQIYKLEEEKNDRETSLRQLQQELADSLKKLSMSEASLEVNTRYRNDLEEEKTRLLRDSDRLKGKLEESEDQYLQAERTISTLKSSLDEREKELSIAAQKLQGVLSTSAASEVTIKQLEEAVQKLEIENARLEAAAKQQSNRIDSLQKGAQEAAMLTGCSPGGGVRGHLEELVTNLQSSKMTLEEQLSREAQKRSVLSHTAQDSHALWEEELKSRSKLGLRLAELEKEKGELTTQIEIEKKRAKRISEQRKAIDARLDQEMTRNAELQKEMYRLRTLLKTAKKKLRDQEAGGAEFGSPVSSLRMDRRSQAEGTFGQIKDKVDDLQVQLEKETLRCSQLEKTNDELKIQIASMRSSSHNSDHLERSKRHLEEEVLDLRRRLEATQVEQSQVEQFRREAEERARQEIQQKLEQVNLFLQSQAASQEALDQIKAANEASLRSQLEQKIGELEGELGRARATHQDSLNQRDSTRTELERYRQLYTDEVHLRKSQAAKLERAKSRLAEANSKLLSERSRSLITSSIANGSLMGPPLDLTSLGSAANYGATIGSLNRNFGLGLSLLGPVTEGQSSRVEDYLTKMRNELDRSISRELSTATAELDAASVRMSLGGTASRVEMDPLSRATQEYLEVLKKNNRI
ncbi:transcript variant X6 [Nothobranchius furzeri]|uniref:Transcript variant X6 n=1 Tax=Nothobranchius furzeri TaxID=105023 RepID=A0A9D2YQE1_NOTFU|nr:transcript variant X6 [Nothobranchius furzeri]